MRLCVSATLLTVATTAQTLAPGAPGKDAYWATAAKQGIGTSATLESKVWFTLAEGVMTEVYYPDVTVANVHLLQFVVVNPKTKKVETERDDADHEIRVGENSLSFTQISSARDQSWTLTKTYTVDPTRSTVLIDIIFSQPFYPVDPNVRDTRTGNDIPTFDLYVYYDPSLANTGMHDSSWLQNGVLIASDGNKTSALISKTGFEKATNGFLASSDGLTQLRQSGQIQTFDRAENGNVVQVAKLGGVPGVTMSAMQVHTHRQIALGFGKNSVEAIATAKASLAKGFNKCLAEYEKGWAEYVKTLPKVDPRYRVQFNMAAMVLKAQEDKTVRGANVASLTIPWGGGANANEDVGGGYHLVWSRDLYHVFTAYMALGDTAAANRALDFLFNIQQKPDGSFPQNSWLDGKKGWGSLQMDEVGYPLIMAWQLSRFDKQTYEKHVKPAADFIVKNGPSTLQERWEEKPGYSPSTIAAEIAGLVCAADIAKRNGDTAGSDLYLKTADDWQSNIERWTATTNGPFGDGHYYVRLTQHGKPDAGEKMELSNSSGSFNENEIVDAGFLELVRLGIKSADDPLIAKSVKVIDQLIKVDTPNGEGFYRYSHDGYGEMDDGRRWNFDGKYTGKGRLWALLAGERGQYELAEYALAKEKEFRPPSGKSNLKTELQREQILLGHATSRLDAMLGFANDGLMIPEQVWDKKAVPQNPETQYVPEIKFGEGTGSATPLAWSMAQFIRLAINIKAGRNLDTPQVVYDRYVKNSQNPAVSSQPGVSPTLTQGEIDCVAEKGNHKAERNATKFPVVKSCKAGTNYAVFAFKGVAKKVQIAGDFSGWKPYETELNQQEQYAPTKQEYDTNKYLSLNFTSSARVEYKLIVDGKWITDPLNPNKIDNGVGGENSVLTMPDYKPTEWDKGSGMTGKLETVDVASKVWNESRRIQVYVPQVKGNVQQSLKRTNPFYPVLYIQDGSDYINRAKAIQIQENLVKASRVKPFIMVFIDYHDRNKEYWASNSYAKFLAEEVVPFVDAKYRTVPNRGGRAIIGTSLGGVTSIWTALKYPEVFGRVGGQSSSLWIDNKRVINELEKLDSSKVKLKFYLDAGTLEGVADSQQVAKILRVKGYDVTYIEGEAGHNWTAWRDRLADAFIALWK
jgi:glucoamylase